MDRQAFEHLCELSRLRMSDREVAEFERKFKSMLQFVEQAQAYKPLSDEPPLAFKEKVDLRRDTVSGFNWPDDQVHDYRVPMIIDFEEGG